jgi:hypothetical protein
MFFVFFFNAVHRTKNRSDKKFQKKNQPQLGMNEMESSESNSNGIPENISANLVIFLYIYARNKEQFLTS